MSAVAPYIVWLIPKVVLGVAVVIGLHLLYHFADWLVDHLRQGPKVREFQDLSPRMHECRELLITYSDSTSEGVRQAAVFGEINVKAGLLLGDLKKLKISVPRFPHANDAEAVIYILSYLASVEMLAEQGRLIEARKMTIDAEWEYKEPNSG